MEPGDYNPLVWECPTCPNTISEQQLIEMDQLSLQEWKISGMCQDCQDDVFDRWSCQDECCD